MRTGLAAAIALAIVPSQSASVSLSSNRAGANNVAVTLHLTYEMQCGWPGPGPLVVTFPAAERLPASIPVSAVLLNGNPGPKVTRSGRSVSVTVPPRKGVTCMVIGPGKATIEFTHAAGLGNPRTRGVYPISVQRGKLVLRTSFPIR